MGSKEGKMSDDEEEVLEDLERNARKRHSVAVSVRPRALTPSGSRGIEDKYPPSRIALMCFVALVVSNSVLTLFVLMSSEEVEGKPKGKPWYSRGESTTSDRGDDGGHIHSEYCDTLGKRVIIPPMPETLRHKRDSLKFLGVPGSYAHVLVGNTVNMTEFTIMGWANMAELSAKDSEACFASQMHPLPRWKFGTIHKVLRFTIFTEEGPIYDCDTLANGLVKVNSWFHFAGSYSPLGGCRIYVNGEVYVSPLNRRADDFKGVLKKSPSSSSSNTLEIGACHQNGYGLMNGRLSQVRLIQEAFDGNGIRKRMFDHVDMDYYSPKLYSYNHLVKLGAGTNMGQDSPAPLEAFRLIPEDVPVGDIYDRYIEMHATLNQAKAQSRLALRTNVDPDRLPLVIVRPLIAKQLALSVWNIERWLETDVTPPCSSTQDVDLLFYFNTDLNDFPEVKEKLLAAVENHPEIRKCFHNIRFLSRGLDPFRDNHPDGPCWQFFYLFETPEIVDHYKYIFQMEPDVQPIRPNWVEALVEEAREVFADALAVPFTMSHTLTSLNGNAQGEFSDFWVKGSMSVCDGDGYAEGDFHINGNGMYKVGDAEFNKLLKKCWSFEQFSDKPLSPGGCGADGYDHVIYDYFVSQEHDDLRKKYMSKYRWSSYILNNCIFPYEPLAFKEKWPNAFMVHSRWGNWKNIFSPEYNPSVKMDENNVL